MRQCTHQGGQILLKLVGLLLSPPRALHMALAHPINPAGRRCAWGPCVLSLFLGCEGPRGWEAQASTGAVQLLMQT